MRGGLISTLALLAAPFRSGNRFGYSFGSYAADGSEAIPYSPAAFSVLIRRFGKEAALRA
jgi:hypothetical protein